MNTNISTDKTGLQVNPMRIARELHGLLTNANVEPPYVMVGPSNGGVSG